MQFFKITIPPYIHTQPEVFSLGLRSMKMHFNIFPSQNNDLNITETLWSVLQSGWEATRIYCVCIIHIYTYTHTHTHIHTAIGIVKLHNPWTNHLRVLFRARHGDARWGCIFRTFGYSHRWYWHWVCGLLRRRGGLSSTTSAATCWMAINVSVQVAYTRCVTQRSLWHTQQQQQQQQPSAAEVRTFQA
jgi:hypothetical protein